MTNIEIVEVESMGEVTQHVIIDKGNGEYTSMPKTVWDEQQTNLEKGM
jgi:hypothetical protein